MIEQLAVGIDGSQPSFDAFDQALALARLLGARLKCVFVVDSRKTQVPIVYTGGAYDISTERIYLPLDPNLRDHYARIAEDLSEFGRNCLGVCRRRSNEAGVDAIGTMRSGYPAAELCEECKSADMLVIGQKGENAHYKRSIVGSTTEDLVRISPRPVLVVPNRARDIHRVLFLYDGSRAAENALRFYVNTMPNVGADFAMVVTGDEENLGGLDKEVSFLRQHDISARVMGVASRQNEDVLAVAEQEDSDLILAGAYGRHKFLEFILGSVAAHLVRRSSVPVLIVH